MKPDAVVQSSAHPSVSDDICQAIFQPLPEDLNWSCPTPRGLTKLPFGPLTVFALT